MFDPTAFDNIKVVVEGAIYDRDLDGEILIVDRKDMIDLANLSRKFSISFSPRDYRTNQVIAKLTIQSHLKNLAAELLDTQESFRLAGAEVTVSFQLKHENDQTMYLDIQQLLEHIWGSDRTITQSILVKPLEKHNVIENDISVKFNRLLREDHIEDLTEMVDYMIVSLQELEKFL